MLTEKATGGVIKHALVQCRSDNRTLTIYQERKEEQNSIQGMYSQTDFGK